MKATATTSISTAMAVEWAEEAISAFGRRFLTNTGFGVCSCDDDWHSCQCAAKYECINWTENGVSVQWDYYGAEIGVYFTPDRLLLQGITCSGTKESVAISLATGEIRYTHEGNRRSGGGAIWDFLPMGWQDVHDVSRWCLESCETLRPEWSVSLPLLRGRFGEGPCNGEEALQAEAEAMLHKMHVKCHAAGYPIPGGLTAMVDLYDPVVGLWAEDGIFRHWKPSFDGFHYRRAAANGVRL